MLNYLNIDNPVRLLSDHLSRLVKGRLWLKVLIGMFLGVAIGMLIGPSTGWLAPGTASTIGNWLALPGQLFLTLIQMIVMPLIFASVVRGLTASESFQQLRKWVCGLKVQSELSPVIAYQEDYVISHQGKFYQDYKPDERYCLVL